MDEITKREATALLGVSERALERYTKQGKLSIRYVRGKRGKEARYSQSEIEQFISERDTPIYQPAIVQDDHQSNYSDALVIPNKSPELVQSLTSLVEAISKTPSILLKDKLLLTIAEAQEITGLGKTTLKKAIAEKQLKAKRIGGSWRIRQDDLKDYINVMFDKVAF